MSEVEDKTDHVNALVYTEETVQDKLYSSCSVNKQGQNLVVWDKSCSSCQHWTALLQGAVTRQCYELMYPEKGLTGDASSVMDYDPRLQACVALCQAERKSEICSR